MNKNLPQTSYTGSPWLALVHRHLAQRQRSRALKVLDDIIEWVSPSLFDSADDVRRDRRLALLCKIEILREAGRLAEALAWTCLECELNPENVETQVLRERLKKALRLDSQESQTTVPQGRDTSSLWAGVAGMRGVKATLERDVIFPLQEPEIYEKYRIDLPNGVLLYGPPGCGKTFIARKLADILDFEFIEVKPSDLASTYVHGGQKKIRELFDHAKEKAPTLLFLDEVDAFLPKR